MQPCWAPAVLALVASRAWWRVRAIRWQRTDRAHNRRATAPVRIIENPIRPEGSRLGWRIVPEPRQDRPWRAKDRTCSTGRTAPASCPMRESWWRTTTRGAAGVGRPGQSSCHMRQGRARDPARWSPGTVTWRLPSPGRVTRSWRGTRDRAVWCPSTTPKELRPLPSLRRAAAGHSLAGSPSHGRHDPGHHQFGQCRDLERRQHSFRLPRVSPLRRSRYEVPVQNEWERSRPTRSSSARTAKWGYGAISSTSVPSTATRSRPTVRMEPSPGSFAVDMSPALRRRPTTSTT